MKQSQQPAARSLWMFFVIVVMVIAGITVGSSFSPGPLQGASSHSTGSLGVIREGLTSRRAAGSRQSNSQAMSSVAALHYNNMTEHPACAFFRSGQMCWHSTPPGERFLCHMHELVTSGANQQNKGPILFHLTTTPATATELVTNSSWPHAASDT
jgi:hypothetical protein